MKLYMNMHSESFSVISRWSPMTWSMASVRDLTLSNSVFTNDSSRERAMMALNSEQMSV